MQFYSHGQGPREDQVGQGEGNPDSAGVAPPALVREAVGALDSGTYRTTTLAGLTLPEPWLTAVPNLAALHLTA